MKLSELRFGDYIKAMFVGRTGSWKTGAIGSFPEPIKILNFDGMDRIQTIKALYPSKDIDFDNLSNRNVPEIEDKLEQIIKNPKKFATYGFDSYSFFMQHAIKYGMKNSTTEMIGQMKVAGLKQFNVEAAAANNLYDIIQQITDCHFLMTAHIIETSVKKPDGSDAVTKKLATAGKAPSVLMPGVFSEVWSFHLEPGQPIGKPPTAYIITQSGAEEGISTLEKSALGAAGALPRRLDYGTDLYAAIKKQLAAKGYSLK